MNSRMARAGLKEQAIFSGPLMEEIQFRSQGIPRLINAVCDNLLLTCFAMETKVATMEMLDEISADLRLDYPSERPLESSPAYTEDLAQDSQIPYQID
jgi:hypothetical protein